MRYLWNVARILTQWRDPRDTTLRYTWRVTRTWCSCSLITRMHHAWLSSDQVQNRNMDYLIRYLWIDHDKKFIKRKEKSVLKNTSVIICILNDKFGAWQDLNERIFFFYRRPTSNYRWNHWSITRGKIGIFAISAVCIGQSCQSAWKWKSVRKKMKKKHVDDLYWDPI